VFAANIILTAISLAVLPDQVAIHFAGGGRPDSWASKEFHTAIFLVLEVPFFLMFYYAAVLPLGVSRKFLNLPNKDYWLREENLVALQRKFGYYMAEFGVAIFTFFFCITLLTIQANLSEPVILNHVWFMGVFITFMIYTLWWLVRLIQGFRVPEPTS
ncbi:MAG: DUF1648 domain-containing protein, partial [Candidatus Krumholzibacteriota bacterium]